MPYQWPHAVLGDQIFFGKESLRADWPLQECEHHLLPSVTQCSKLIDTFRYFVSMEAKICHNETRNPDRDPYWLYQVEYNQEQFSKLRAQ